MWVRYVGSECGFGMWVRNVGSECGGSKMFPKMVPTSGAPNLVPNLCRGGLYNIIGFCIAQPDKQVLKVESHMSGFMQSQALAELCALYARICRSMCEAHAFFKFHHS